MAKTGFWLRGAKGKLAGSVLQKGENGTIVRDHVVPTNPQSSRQMLQRVAFATMALAAKFMLPIIGQTFEGAGNETKNRRQFMKVNVNRLKALYNAYIEAQKAGTVADLENIGYALPKGVKTLVPNPYIIAQGSLLLPSAFSISKEDNGFEYYVNTQTISSGIYSAGKLWTMLFGLVPGQQLTYVAINNRANSSSADRPGPWLSPDFLMRQGRLYASRLVLKSSGSTITITSSTTAQDIITCLTSLIDMEKSAQRWAACLSNPEFITVTTETTGINVQIEMSEYLPYINEVDSNLYYLAAQGCILSELTNDKWAYSNSELVSLNSEDDNSSQGSWGTTYDTAAPTYVKSTETSSDLYTRQGGDTDVLGE